MNIILPIIASIVIVYIWIWILNTIFSEKKMKRLISIRILLCGIFLVGTLFLYTYFSERFPQLAGFSLQPAMINGFSLLLFILFCGAITIILTMIFRNRYGKILQIILIGALFFFAISYGSYFLGLNVLLVYYLVSAYAEEYMKYSAGNNLLYEEKRINKTDLILFCILIALGFSFIENILYIVVNILRHNEVSILQLLVGRGIVSTLIHVVCTGLIAFITISFRKIHTIIIPTLIGILAGFGIHSLYNIGLSYKMSYISVPLIVICFFLLTFLFFRSDSLYTKKA